MDTSRGRAGMRGGILAAVAVAMLALGQEGLSHAADESAWETLLESARLAEAEGRLDDAERFLVEARTESERPGTAPLLRVRSVEALADFYHRSGRHAEAEPLFLECIDLWDETFGTRQPRVGIPLHNLAVMYLEQCRVDDALPLIRRTVDLWERTLDSRHPDRVDAIVTEATLLRRCGRDAEAAAIETRLPDRGPATVQ